MRTLKISLLVISFSFMTPLKAQWVQAYAGATGQFYGFYFVDSLNGWFTQFGLDRIIHTSDGGYNFDIQSTPVGIYGQMLFIWKQIK